MRRLRAGQPRLRGLGVVRPAALIPEREAQRQRKGTHGWTVPRGTSNLREDVRPRGLTPRPWGLVSGSGDPEVFVVVVRPRGPYSWSAGGMPRHLCHHYWLHPSRHRGLAGWYRGPWGLRAGGQAQGPGFYQTLLSKTP